MTVKSTFFNQDFGLPIETRTRTGYTRVTFANNVTVYDNANYWDYRFTGRLGSSRADEFAEIHGGRVLPAGNVVRIYKR
jgi:hypothetical protein